MGSAGERVPRSPHELLGCPQGLVFLPSGCTSPAEESLLLQTLLEKRKSLSAQR